MTSDVARKWTHKSPGSVATDSSLARIGLITNSFLRLGLPSHSCMEKLCGKGAFHFLRLPITLTTEIGRPQRLKLQHSSLRWRRSHRPPSEAGAAPCTFCLSVWNRLQAQTRRHTPEWFHTASGRELGTVSIRTYKVVPLWNSLAIIHTYCTSLSHQLRI